MISGQPEIKQIKGTKYSKYFGTQSNNDQASIIILWTYQDEAKFL